jgi:thioredoxin-dependent peroxiredoxin
MDLPRLRAHDCIMKRPVLIAAAALLASLVTMPASAALRPGTQAPALRTQGALAGRTFTFDLQQALRRGPVVLYFFPKAFTQGCTLEAHAFAEAMPDFRAAGAQVIGLSADDLPTLRRFSTEECRDAFPVAIASPATIRAFDVALQRDGQTTGLSDRTSYVIGRNGRVVMVHSDGDWRQHVQRTLAAVRSLDR